jgi:hypothetical protein
MLKKANPTTVFLVTLVLILASLFTPGPLGGVLLLIVAGLAAWLLLGTWQRLDPLARGIRLAILALLVVLAVQRFV